VLELDGPVLTAKPRGPYKRSAAPKYTVKDKRRREDDSDSEGDSMMGSIDALGGYEEDTTAVSMGATPALLTAAESTALDKKRARAAAKEEKREAKRLLKEEARARNLEARAERDRISKEEKEAWKQQRREREKEIAKLRHAREAAAAQTASNLTRASGATRTAEAAQGVACVRPGTNPFRRSLLGLVDTSADVDAGRASRSAEGEASGSGSESESGSGSGSGSGSESKSKSESESGSESEYVPDKQLKRTPPGTGSYSGRPAAKRGRRWQFLYAETVRASDATVNGEQWPQSEGSDEWTPVMDAVVLEMLVLCMLFHCSLNKLKLDRTAVPDDSLSEAFSGGRGVWDSVLQEDWRHVPVVVGPYSAISSKDYRQSWTAKLGIGASRAIVMRRLRDLIDGGRCCIPSCLRLIIAQRGLGSDRLLGHLLREKLILPPLSGVPGVPAATASTAATHLLARVTGLYFDDSLDDVTRRRRVQAACDAYPHDVSGTVMHELLSRDWAAVAADNTPSGTRTLSDFGLMREGESDYAGFLGQYGAGDGDAATAAAALPLGLSFGRGIPLEFCEMTPDEAEDLVMGEIPEGKLVKGTEAEAALACYHSEGGRMLCTEALALAHATARGAVGAKLWVHADSRTLQPLKRGRGSKRQAEHTWYRSDQVSPQRWIGRLLEPCTADVRGSGRRSGITGKGKGEDEDEGEASLRVASVLGSLHRGMFNAPLNSIHTVITIPDDHNVDDGDDDGDDDDSGTSQKAAARPPYRALALPAVTPAPTTSTPSSADAHPQDLPWVLPDGVPGGGEAINAAFLTQLRGRVCTILSSSPGASLERVTGELALLPPAHCAALMQRMEEEGLLERRVAHAHADLTQPGLFRSTAAPPPPPPPPQQPLAYRASNYFLTVNMPF
jgi:hypothetical protein